MRQTIQNANASLVLNGSSSVVTVATPATGLSSLVSSFAAGGWIYNTAIRTNFPVVLQLWGGSGNPTGMQIYIGGGTRLCVKAKIGGTQYDSTVASGLPQGRWVHVFATFDGTTLTGYINGVAQSTVTTVGGTVAITNNEILLGSSGSTWAKGNMSNMVIAPYMTAAQVLALYQSGTVPTGATAVYPLNEGAGSIAYDRSGNGNNGTITSGTWSRETPSKTRTAVNGNMVYNGDFEIAPVVNVATTSGDKWIDGTASGAAATADPVFGWYVWNYTTSYAAMFDTSVKHSGTASMKLSTTATASTVGLKVSVNNSQGFKKNNIPVLPSTSYTYSVWIKTQANSGSATTGTRFQLVTTTGVSDVLTTTVVTGLVATQDWTQYTGTVTTGATARYITPLLQIVGNDGAGTLIMDAWFDDIQLYPTTPITRSANTLARRPVDELVYNGDFEYAPAFTAATTTSGKWIDGTAGGSTNSSAYGWGLVAGTANGVAQFDDTVSKFGTKSLKISTLTGVIVAPLVWTGLSTSRNDVVRYAIPVLPNTSYTLTYWMKTNLTSGTSGQGAFAAISERDGVGGFIPSDTFGTRVTTTTDWTQYTVTKTTGASTRFIGVKLTVDSTVDLVMDAWFDNVSLKLTTPTGRSAA